MYLPVRGIAGPYRLLYQSEKKTVNQHLITDALTAFNLVPARADYTSAVDFFHATQEAHAALEDALRFWVATYQAGVRIVLDGKDAFFHAVDGYPNRRVVDTQAFGDFDEPALVRPTQEIVLHLHRCKAYLLPFLKTAPPDECRPFFWHLLTMDEAQTVSRHAALNGERVAIMVTGCGCFLLHLGKREPVAPGSCTLPEQPAIFAEYRKLVI